MFLTSNCSAIHANPKIARGACVTRNILGLILHHIRNSMPMQSLPMPDQGIVAAMSKIATKPAKFYSAISKIRISGRAL